jgi:hypothetical protein
MATAGHYETRSDVKLGGFASSTDAPHGAREADTMVCHMAAKPGSVFAVVSMFSTATPGTRNPMRAPEVAMR